MAFKSYKDLSLIGWGKEYCGNSSQYPSDSQLQLGFSQRIAEAIERLAVGTTELDTQTELDKTKVELRYARGLVFAYKKSVAAYKGRITKLKKLRVK